MDARTARQTIGTLASDTLIDALRIVFPNRLPPEGTDQRELDRLQGEQRVIQMIATAHEAVSRRSGGGVPLAIGTNALIAELESRQAGGS